MSQTDESKKTSELLRLIAEVDNLDIALEEKNKLKKSIFDIYISTPQKASSNVNTQSNIIEIKDELLGAQKKIDELLKKYTLRSKS